MVSGARRLVIMAVLAGLSACGEAPSGPEAPTPPPGFAAVVSDPFTHRPATTVVTANRPAFSGAMIDGLAFVSVAPGTVPEADRATVLNTRTGQQIAPSVVDGGFDPVGIGAEAGDTVVTTLSSESGVVAYAKSVVPARRRPRVVRTSPARGRIDVAINANITIVFSEPIDPATLTPTSVTLVQGSDTVPGMVRPNSGSSVTAEFLPHDALDSGTRYQLLVSPTIRDLSGDMLEPEAATEFTTAANPMTPVPPPEEPFPSDPEAPAPEPPVPPESEVPPGSHLEFLTQPGNTTAFTNFAPAVRVALRDAQGATVTSYSGRIAMQLAPSSDPGTLRQFFPMAAIAGVATFPMLSVDAPGEYALVASAGPGVSATSEPFTIGESPWTTVEITAGNGHGRREYAASAVMDGTLYSLGGTTDSEDMLGATDLVDAFDPAAGTYSSRAPMPAPRKRAGAGVVDGIIYVVGGSDESGVMQPSVFAYDPATDSWSERAPLPSPVTHPGIGSINGILYAVGGIGAGENAVGTTWRYDPAINEWTPAAEMPTPRGGPVIGVVDGFLYAIGGGFGYSAVNSVEAYDPTSDRWTARQPMPTPRGFMGIAETNGRIYVLGGFDLEAFHWVSHVEVYDPAADLWSAIPGLPFGGQTIAGAIDGVIYAFPDGGGPYRYRP